MNLLCWCYTPPLPHPHHPGNTSKQDNCVYTPISSLVCIPPSLHLPFYMYSLILPPLISPLFCLPPLSIDIPTCTPSLSSLSFLPLLLTAGWSPPTPSLSSLLHLIPTITPLTSPFCQPQGGPLFFCRIRHHQARHRHLPPQHPLPRGGRG